LNMTHLAYHFTLCNLPRAGLLWAFQLQEVL
jgi:hypothetical protein